MKWKETSIETPDGIRNAIAPEIISASRSTDIPAIHADWLMNRLRQGYVKWINPFNQRLHYISFANTRVIVFWSKNPRPLLRYLDEIDERHPAYYFHFTLNDYEKERLEPGVPPLAERIESFQMLSEKIGRDRVIWRFDPLILTSEMGVESLLEKIGRVGQQIARFTTKLVFSFADISNYQKVRHNLKRSGVTSEEFTQELMITAAAGIAELCKGWNIQAATCAETTNLAQFGIEHNRCIDEALILKITNHSEDLCRLFGMDAVHAGDLFATPAKITKKIKDPGQRAACGCVYSKDIGQYNTCPHACVYCYANTSESMVRKNIESPVATGESIA